MRNLRKGLRDLLIVAISAGLLYFSEHLSGYGLPKEYIPLVSAIALAAYRYLRDNISVVESVDPK